MSANEVVSESIYFIETSKIVPNPYQPRREFDEDRLRDLSESIRQYGVLQPLVVSRIETPNEHGGFSVQYELIAGERRFRASKMAGLSQVPAVIRKEENPMLKLELAIIENLQREDLNPIDRARAFMRLATEFGFSHTEIGKKVGKSREYVSNSLRMLQMPQEIIDALSSKKINEGHTRPLLMLNDRPDEQSVLFKEIVFKKMTVREAERIARGIAKEKVRKQNLLPDPEIEEMQNRLQETLGTRVHIDKRDVGGKITIDFFSAQDLEDLLKLFQNNGGDKKDLLERHIASKGQELSVSEDDPYSNMPEDTEMLDDRTKEEKQKSEQDADLYSISNFSI
ncbi:MAG: ParB/RepB/Spo0J family partition protein [Bacteroidetes bacterium]|nr:ParB/RepB/Spo0J family partition protein [Bacteroidota bacterium]